MALMAASTRSPRCARRRWARRRAGDPRTVARQAADRQRRRLVRGAAGRRRDQGARRRRREASARRRAGDARRSRRARERWAPPPARSRAPSTASSTSPSSTSRRSRGGRRRGGRAALLHDVAAAAADTGVDPALIAPDLAQLGLATAGDAAPVGSDRAAAAAVAGVGVGRRPLRRRGRRAAGARAAHPSPWIMVDELVTPTPRGASPQRAVRDPRRARGLRLRLSLLPLDPVPGLLDRMTDVYDWRASSTRC